MPADRLARNARITMQHAARVRPGENVVILTEERSKDPYRQELIACVRALAAATVELGAHPLLIDIHEYSRSAAFQAGHVHPLLQRSLLDADVVVNAADYIPFSRLAGEGSSAEGAWKSDQYLTGERRWLALQSHGMDAWDISAEQVQAIHRRTRWLQRLVPLARQGRITSRLGTDFTFGLGPQAVGTPVLAIVPLYGELAVAPVSGTEHGRLVFDGPTQRGVRPRGELDRIPLDITVEQGRVGEIRGDAVQLGRLQAFMRSGSPIADRIDEVGLVTTPIPENDAYWWEDGTHHHDTVHVAIGNNLEKAQQVHGVCHMDGEIRQPTVSIDGVVIIRDGVFCDENVTD